MKYKKNTNEEIQEIYYEFYNSYKIDLNKENIFSLYSIEYRTNILKEKDLLNIRKKIDEQKKKWEQRRNIGINLEKSLNLATKYEKIFENIFLLNKAREYYLWRERWVIQEINNIFLLIGKEKKRDGVSIFFEKFYNVENISSKVKWRKLFSKKTLSDDSSQRIILNTVERIIDIKEKIEKLEIKYRNDITEDIEKYDNTKKYVEIIKRRQMEFARDKIINSNLSNVSDIYNNLAILFTDKICKYIELKECKIMWKYQDILPYLCCIQTLHTKTLIRMFKKINKWVLSEEIINTVIIPLCHWFEIEFDAKKTIEELKYIKKKNIRKEKAVQIFHSFGKGLKHVRSVINEIFDECITRVDKILLFLVEKTFLLLAYWPLYFLKLFVFFLCFTVKYFRYVSLILLIPLIRYQLIEGPTKYIIDYRYIFLFNSVKWDSYIAQAFQGVEYTRFDYYIMSILVIIIITIIYIGPIILVGIILWNIGRYLNDDTNNTDVLEKNVYAKLNNCKETINLVTRYLCDIEFTIGQAIAKAFLNVLCVGISVLCMFVINYSFGLIKANVEKIKLPAVTQVNEVLSTELFQFESEESDKLTKATGNEMMSEFYVTDGEVNEISYEDSVFEIIVKVSMHYSQESGHVFKRKISENSCLGLFPV